jgi:hypothetical protein
MVFDRAISPSEPGKLWLGHSRKSLPRACPYLGLSLIDSDLNQIASYAYAVLDNVSFNEMISMEIGALVFLLLAAVGLDLPTDHLAPLRFAADVANLPHDIVGRRNVAK